MADRQSQGLQIALIAAVMLDIVFGVVAYLMWRQFDEQKTAAAAAATAKTTAETAQRAAVDEARMLKEWMGFASTDTKDAIQKAKDAQMTAFDDAFPKGYPPADRVYRKVVQTLYEVVKARDASIKTQQASLDKAYADLAAARTEADATVAAEHKNTVDAQTERDNERKDFDSKLKHAQAEQQRLADQNTREQATAAARDTKLQGMVAASTAKADDFRQRYADEKGKNEALRKETFEVPTGKVISVNQAQGIVYINLGEADLLGRLTKFTVYDANTSDVSRGGKKATIEVTRLTGPHQAEAHIVDSTFGNPVLSGDVIYTPVWKPGQKRRFVLVGLMDVDGDKKTDLDLVRNLIAANGGVVDSYREMDSIGRGKNVRVGKMTADTDFLIKGSEPDPQAGTQADFKDIRDMEVQADRNLVKKITLKDFLTKIGWVSESSLQKFGPGYRAQDFRPRLPPGTQPVSSGNVSPLFKPRQPQSGATGTN